VVKKEENEGGGEKIMPTYWTDFIDKQLKKDRWYLAHHTIQTILEDFFEYLVEEDVIPDNRTSR